MSETDLWLVAATVGTVRCAVPALKGRRSRTEATGVRSVA